MAKTPGTKSTTNYFGSTYSGPKTSTRSFATPGSVLDADDVVKRLMSSYMTTRLTYTAPFTQYMRMPSVYDNALYASQLSRKYSPDRKYQ